MDIYVVLAPDKEYGDKVRVFLRHKGDIWQWHMEKTFRGETGQLQSRFYIGVVDERVVGNVSTWEYGPTGILAHVFTAEDQRRKGICSALTATAVNDFRRRGGKILTLGTGYDSPPYHIYRSFGFESMVKGSGSMRYDVMPGFEEAFFSPSEVHCRPLEWRDWSTLNVLFAIRSGDRIRNLFHAVIGPASYEDAFLHDLTGLLRGLWQANVLESEEGALVGYLTLIPDFRWRSEVWLLDIFIHPLFAPSTWRLLGATHWPMGKVQCYVEADAYGKLGALLKAGFRMEATFLRHIRKGETSVDVHILTR